MPENDNFNKNFKKMVKNFEKLSSLMWKNAVCLEDLDRYGLDGYIPQKNQNEYFKLIEYAKKNGLDAVKGLSDLMHMMISQASSMPGFHLIDKATKKEMLEVDKSIMHHLEQLESGNNSPKKGIK